MRKGSDLIGKPLIAFNSGQQFERIRDLIFDQSTNQLLGFLVDEGGWFSSARVLPLQGVQTIGPDAVIVPDKNAVVTAGQVPPIRAILERNNVLKGTKIMTTDGRDLGTLADLYFDEQSGIIEGYEVSGGVFADAYSGRSFVPAPQTINIGEHVAFVPPETADMMEEQVGGFRGSVQSAGDSLIATAQTAGDRLQEATQSASSSLTNRLVEPDEQRAFVIGKTAQEDVLAPDGTLLVTRGQLITPMAVDEAEQQGALDRLYHATGGTLTAGITNRSNAALAPSTVDAAYGRRVQHAVRTDEGLIIAAPSQIVTDSVIERARRYNKEQELLDAVGLSTGDALRTRAGDTAARADDRLRAGTQQVQESASDLWSRVKEKVGGLQERTEQEAHERRIKHALGRPVSRVILDPQDNVILNVGEIITHRAIDMAEQSGVLDLLLSSVYDREPQISNDEMRAAEPGEASLEREHGTGA